MIQRPTLPLRRFMHWGKRKAAQLGYCSKPSFLIIGAQKAGTSALFSMLDQHPQIVAPRNKELAFFNDKEIPVGPRYGDFSAYHAMFPLPYRLPRGSMTFEATPEYLVFPECPERIRQYDPDMKLIAILREPVARAYSGWNMFRNFANSSNPVYRLLAESRTFEAAVAEEIKRIEQGRSTRPWNYVSTGMYAEHLQRYFQVFPRDSLLILDHADLLRDPGRCLAAACRFLGIDDTFAFSTRQVHVARYESPIPEGAAHRLRAFYRPLNAELCRLLDRAFAWGGSGVADE